MATTASTPVDPALTEKPICKVRERTNASMGGMTQKDRSQFATDQKLKDLLATADDIKSLEHFIYWKDEFLSTFRHYLDPVESANARVADEKLYARLQKLAKSCLRVKTLCSEGGIDKEGSSVRGIKALNEFVAEISRVEKDVEDYFPKTSEDEQNVGYNKFNVAAVLVRDGFRVYELIVITRDYIASLRDGPLQEGDILKPNARSIINYYFKVIDTLCDTLADLGLHKLMDKCVELYKIRPRNKKKKVYDRATMDPLSDSSDEENINGGRMFRRPKKNFRAIMDKGWTSGMTGEEIHDPVEDEKAEEEDAVHQPKAQDEDEEPDPQMPEEWIYYWDATSETIGKIPRRRAMLDGFIIRADGQGNEDQEAAVREWDDKDGVKGKGSLIWDFKDACKGKAHKKPTNGRK
eukprot:Nitzschia sp. Nitz4//scaffold117_size69655//67930//69153//NITZ4_006033-RA/size69655-processed-gene-0.33-mRNA-1//1//CDS//3329533678//9305//frame0